MIELCHSLSSGAFHEGFSLAVQSDLFFADTSAVVCIVLSKTVAFKLPLEGEIFVSFLKASNRCLRRM